jgi:hypothetical protein
VRRYLEAGRFVATEISTRTKGWPLRAFDHHHRETPVLHRNVDEEGLRRPRSLPRGSCREKRREVVYICGKLEQT